MRTPGSLGRPRSRGAALIPLALTAVVLAAGCSWRADERDLAAEGPGLQEVVTTLPSLEVPEPAGELPDRTAALAAYRQVYGAIPDPRTDREVGKRLADLEMSVGEDQDLAGAPDPYRPAIRLYESLLARSDGRNRDEILYQLSRAEDLSGNRDATVRYLDQLVSGHPDSAFVLEARFRRAEIAFSEERYRAAADDYGLVADAGADSPYWQNASYMQGWSLFKLSDLDGSLRSLFAVVDALAPAPESGNLAAAERELLDDSFRVITLALSYLEGPQTLADHMAALGEPRWQYLAYQALAGDYLHRERYLDSVATWQTFVDRNPLDARAPHAHIGMIRTLVEADFPSEVLPRKEEFVRRYGVHSEFWAVHEPAVRADYLDTLKSYLDELATLAHGQAQDSGAREDYLTAAGWYEERLATFPDDPAAPEHLFLLGEVYTEARSLPRAVAAYQRVVREHPGHPRAPEAGYAAILGLDELAAGAAADPGGPAPGAVGASQAFGPGGWQLRRVEAQVEFARTFPSDPRAARVLTAAAESLFEFGDHVGAVALADELFGTWPDLVGPLRTTGLLVLGHGRFELGEYAAAEGAYARLLRGDLPDADAAAVSQRLLASIYRQGEAAEARGEPDQAVHHYLRLREVDPGAELTAQGHYDAVAVIQNAGRLAEAAALLADFRQRYPDHPLGEDVPRRLAALYEETGDAWLAAAEYVRLADGDADAETRRQARYRAGELYLEMDDLPRAAVQFAEYVERHPEPADLRLEAAHHLDVVHQQLGDAEGQRRWLTRKVQIHEAMGSAATDRATYLAADAQYRLAEHARAEFDGIRLSRPLQRSLERKRRALQQTVEAFEAAAGYGVAEFLSASTFRIADLYAALSRAILASERPEGLSELEREQYEILLEEQAFPFEEQAISLHEINMRRSWEGAWDPWIEKSFAELGRLMPARFDKPEMEVAYVESIH